MMTGKEKMNQAAAELESAHRHLEQALQSAVMANSTMEQNICRFPRNTAMNLASIHDDMRGMERAIRRAINQLALINTDALREVPA